MKTLLLSGAAALGFAAAAWAQQAPAPVPPPATEDPAPEASEAQQGAAPDPTSTPPGTPAPRDAATAPAPARDPAPEASEAQPAAAPDPTSTPMGEPAPRAAAATAAAPPSTSAMVNLIRALVAQRAITPQQGEALLAQAEAEAASARAAAPPPGTVRVPYVPETVRAQIREELKGEVLQAAREEGWAQPGQVAEWTRGIAIAGDFRVRDQFTFYDDGNSDQIVDYALANAGGPLELNQTSPTFIGFPFLNTRQDRVNRLFYRLRLGVTAQVTPKVEVGIRLASGDDRSPVSTSGLLGGGFGKKDLWIDRVYFRFKPLPEVAGTIGRFANPFYFSEALFDNDLNFDGVLLAADTGDQFGRAFKLGATAGVFPYEYGAENPRPFAAPPPQGGAVERRDDPDQQKWLYAAQLVANWQANDRVAVKAGVAFYSFDGVQGEVSEPCELFRPGNFQCSTDRLRPAFQQKGNTLFALRDIIGPVGQPNFATPQFFGLTFDYDILNFNADVDVKLDDQLHLVVGGDYIKNIGFDEDDVCRAYSQTAPGDQGALRPPINNVDVVPDAQGLPINPCTSPGSYPGGAFQGGDTAWTVRATIGHPRPQRLGEWNILASYRYIESDAMLDGITDSNFYRGGTNAEGYIVAGTVGLHQNFTARARWFSANEVSGPPLAIDVLQVDLLVNF